MLVQKFLGRSATSIASIRHSSSAFLNLRRFYKEVSVSSVKDNKFEILLDKRILKTPKKAPLIIESEPLALAIAKEWDSQKELINIPQMRLSGLAFTTIDNPNHETGETLADKIVEYLDNDTLLYFTSSPEELCKLEHEKWLPIINWANEKHGFALRPSYSVTEMAEVSDESRSKLHQYFLSMGFPALNGLLYGADSIKSVLLLFACLQSRVSVEEAAHLANLEQEYQGKVYQRIEGHHDVQEFELLNRLAAAIFYIQVSTQNEARTPFAAESV